MPREEYTDSAHNLLNKDNLSEENIVQTFLKMGYIYIYMVSVQFVIVFKKKVFLFLKYMN